MTEAPERLGHAALDLPSRRLKGLKVERLLALVSGDAPLRVLEVGTGSGGIAHYFATHPILHCEVDAVDVEDVREVRDSYRFRIVAGTALPFDDASFDVVVSNHVIEHVGELDAQRHHLRELRRVMRAGAAGYLAVPNRWMLVEPHFHLPFLSWLPRSLRTPYVRATGRGRVYDCRPLQLGELEGLLADAGFAARNVCIEAVRQLYRIERPQARAGRLLERVPDRALAPFLRIIPTLIYRLDKA